MAKILIVDDSRTSRKILKSILTEAGHEIIGEATNGEEAVKMYDELNPDLVTLDITMPVMDGLSALKIIMTDHPDATVIMVTAAGQKSKMVEAIKEGASEFIQKPFEPEQILSVVKTIV